MITDELYCDYQSKLLAGDRLACSRIVKHLLENGIEIFDLYVNLFQRSLYEVGSLWENNKISVAKEHLSTSITEHLMSLAYPYLFEAEHCGKKAVVISTPGEFHQIGARMVADYFELHGWDGYFLPLNLSDNQLFSFVDEHNPNLIAISLSVYFNLQSLLNLSEKIARKYPEIQIIAGGQGFQGITDESFGKYPHIRIVRSLEALKSQILKITK